MHTHVHLCANCGDAYDHTPDYDCEKPAHWGFCGDSCRLESETRSFDKSALRDHQRILAERRSLAMRSRSERHIDTGKQPISDSPLFGGPAQRSLF